LKVYGSKIKEEKIKGVVLRFCSNGTKLEEKRRRTRKINK
jgi:hypothetical protein